MNTNNGNNRQRKVPPKKKPAPPPQTSFAEELLEFLREVFSRDNIELRRAMLGARLKSLVRSFGLHVFYARERILCGAVVFILMVFFVLIQTTVFSNLRPFGAIPDLMLMFTLALSVSEGGRWGAVWGIVAAVFIEAVGCPEITLLPLLYMPVGYFAGNLCRYYFTGSAAVRALLTVSVLPLRAVFTAVYMTVSPLYATAGEIFFDVILPEAASTLLLAAPVHLIVYLCTRPFHRTRADMVSER